MTIKRTLAAALVAAAGVLGTAAPAAAVCDPVIYEVTGRCENSCTIAGKAVRIADDALGRPIADRDIYITCAA